MRGNLFWTHRSVFEAAGLDVGFGMFTTAHFLWLGVMLLCIVGYAAVYVRGDEGRRENLRKSLGFFIILFEICKQCVMALTGAPIQDNLPPGDLLLCRVRHPC